MSILVGGFKPFEKNISQIRSFPPGSTVKIPKHLLSCHHLDVDIWYTSQMIFMPWGPYHQYSWSPWRRLRAHDPIHRLSASSLEACWANSYRIGSMYGIYLHEWLIFRVSVTVNIPVLWSIWDLNISKLFGSNWVYPFVLFNVNG